MILAAARRDAWRWRWRAAVILGAILGSGIATAARATVEEFSTFSVLAQEGDDESVLDHLLTRLPRAWDDQWVHAANGFRTSQGCLTSGEWFIDTDFKARAPMGKRAWLGVELFQSESDILNVQNLDLTFHYPQAHGTAFALFRPSAAKASQDFALGWETGADTTDFHLRATWTLEDVFNNFWAFRQTQVGGLSEPYERRPYEPALAFAVRKPDWRIEADAKWLTPSRKRIENIVSHQAMLSRDLWGATGGVRLERRVGPVVLEADTRQRQARGRDVPIIPTAEASDDFRRQWSAEGVIRSQFGGSPTTVEARYIYQRNTGRLRGTASPWSLRADHRLLNLDVIHAFNDRVTARVGGLYDRIGVSQSPTQNLSYGTRNESRAYLGLALRFGRVLFAGVEGIELDPEPYPVWFVHDKGFLQLQTTF